MPYPNVILIRGFLAACQDQRNGVEGRAPSSRAEFSRQAWQSQPAHQGRIRKAPGGKRHTACLHFLSQRQSRAILSRHWRPRGREPLARRTWKKGKPRFPHSRPDTSYLIQPAAQHPRDNRNMAHRPANAPLPLWLRAVLDHSLSLSPSDSSIVAGPILLALTLRIRRPVTCSTTNRSVPATMTSPRAGTRPSSL